MLSRVYDNFIRMSAFLHLDRIIDIYNQIERNSEAVGQNTYNRDSHTSDDAHKPEMLASNMTREIDVNISFELPI